MPIVYNRVDFGAPWNDNAEDERLLQERLAAGWRVDTRRENPEPPRALPAGVTDSDFLPEIAPRAGDVVVKTRHSGFYNTNLHEILQDLGIKALVFTGGTISVCVESALRDAFFRDYHCVLLADCTAEPIGHRLARTNYDATLHLVEMVFGWVTTSHALVEALAESRGWVGMA
jgi:ureidoacrylate peracid hydrolase